MIASILVNALRMLLCSSANCIIMCYLPTYSYIYDQWNCAMLVFVLIS